MKSLSKEELILEWKRLRGIYFGLLNEDINKFNRKCSNHILYQSVLKNLNTSFRDINQIAELEIDNFLKKQSK